MIVRPHLEVYTVSDALYEAEFQREGSTVPPEAIGATQLDLSPSNYV